MPAELLLTKQGAWTLDHLAALPDDGRRYEILDGSLLVSPPPSNYHSGLAFELATLLRRHQPVGYRTLSPGAVELGPVQTPPARRPRRSAGGHRTLLAT